MKPTSIPWLLGVGLISALLGWGFAAWVDANGRLPAVPWMAVVFIWVVAGFVAPGPWHRAGGCTPSPARHAWRR